MIKAPKPKDEALRLKALYEYQILDSLEDKDFDDFTNIASHICQTPIALISFVDEARQWFKSKVGLDVSETPRDVAFCAHAILQNEVFMVKDTLEDSRFHDNPFVTNNPSVRFYAGAPLSTSCGLKIGTLCVIDHSPKQLNDQQLESLLALSRQIMNLLELRLQREASRRSLQLIQQNPTAIFCKDYHKSEGQFIEWNDAAEKLWGYRRENVIGKTTHEIFPKEHAEIVEVEDTEVIRKNTMKFVNQEPLSTAKGIKVLRHWRMPISDRDGNPRYLLGVSIDITRQVELKKQLVLARKEAEENARSLDLALEGANLGVWDWNLKTNAVNFDRRWMHMLGLDPSSTAMVLSTWEDLVHPDDLEACYKDIEAYREGKTERYENIHRMKHGNGEWVFILDRGRFSAWDKDGNPTRFTGTHLDISPLEKSKMELQSARKRFEEAEVTGKFGSWEFDLKTGKGNWTKGHNLLFGLSDEEEVLTSDYFLSRVHPEDQQIFYSLMEEIKSGAKDSFEMDYRIYHIDGSIRFIKGYGIVEKNQYNEFIRIRGTAQDITDLKVLQNELISSREEALAATKTKSVFLANMSHEIRTPMNGIIGMANLLADTIKDEDQKEKIKIVQNSGHSLLRIINDVLDFSKIEAGKIEVEQVPFDLNVLIKEVIYLFEPIAMEKGIELTFKNDIGEKSWVNGDSTRVRQILSNLVTNSLKFTAKGKVEVTSKVIIHLPEKRTIQISVEDSGIGIESQMLDRLFLPFSQIDASTTRNYGGTGLGLTICKGLVEAMGGDIKVESEKGIGTKITFRFPFEVTKSYEDATAPLLQEDSVMEMPFIPLKILIAEDNRVNQIVVKGILEKLGYTVDLAVNGKEVLDALKRKRYDLILMDCHMPLLDGFETTSQIVSMIEKNHRPRIVALSASTMKEDIERCFASGMDGFLSKPLDVSQLKIELAKCK